MDETTRSKTFSETSRVNPDDADVIAKVLNLRDKGRQLGLSDEEIYKTFTSSIPEYNHLSTSSPSDTSAKGACVWKTWPLTTKRNVFLAFVVCTLALNTTSLYDLSQTDCWSESHAFTDELRRPPFPCQVCQNLTQVPVVSDITQEEFARHYGFTGVPLLVRNAITHWKALDAFSFHFLKKLYLSKPGVLEKLRKECPFFFYNTDFYSLAEVFNMSDDRANFSDGEKNWYVGWGDCIGDVDLWQYYDRPHFLPSASESDSVEWIFMGGPGLGASLHIDFVRRPSWQAQLSGSKTWTLVPGPECASICHEMNVTVEKGDVFTIDTNEWYHATYIHPGNLSITIGSEYQ